MAIDKLTADSIPAKTWTFMKRAEKIPVLTMSIRRPTFPEHGKTARVEHYFSRLSQYWQNRWESILYPEACQSLEKAQNEHIEFSPWLATLDYSVTYWNYPTISFRIEVTETGRTTRPLHIHQGETWDLQIGYPRTLRSFFPINAKHWRKDIINLLKEQAQDQINSGESLLDPNCPAVMERTFDPDRFYLSENGINLFYPLYILGPYAEGIPTFFIPFPMETQANTFSS